MFNKNQTGLALGALFASMHFFWALIVWLGAGKWFINIMHNMHFITNELSIAGLKLGIVILGIILAFVCGYIIGWGFAWFGNFFAKNK